MGVAAYNRGSRAISTQFAREAYAKGLSPFSPDAVPAKPTPRLADWGSKALQKAVEMVRKQIRGRRKIAALREERLDLDAALDGLADYLWSDRGVARETARKAVEIVRAEEATKRNPRRWR